MKTTHKGRTIEIRSPHSPHNRYGAPAYGINGVWKTEPTESPLLGRPGQSTAELLDELKRFIDQLDAEPNVRHTTYVWWYAPGRAEICPRSKNRVSAEHTKGVGAPCTDPGCRREAALEAQRRARRTGITAASLASVLTRAGYVNAEKHWDGVAKSAGFMASGEDRNRRVAVLWSKSLGPGRVCAELAEIADFLAGKGYRVEVTPAAGALWVFPKGSAGERPVWPAGRDGWAAEEK
ncbi:hypothetical protein ACFC1T_09090 [Kitasatospora sp. NPDC056076]|uniref:hypothetical protein n=1 Tax=Kitasatospora sp. NPDC056076 TaxID=3345703 RepID=UPI0035D57B57